MNKLATTFLLIQLSLFSFSSIQAQDSTINKKPGNLWGLAYGDFAWKIKSDSLNRGGLNQYTGLTEGQTLFQIRRLYFGYDYEISKTFYAEFLLALEDNLVTTATNPTVTSGNLLNDNKMSLFVKLANVKWKNIFKGSDLSIGEMYTPAVVENIEPIWDYRCIERTISDIRRTPAWDLGISLKGKMIHTDAAKVGYHIMVGNGSVSRPENDIFKTFYANINAKFLNNKLIIDLYADYTRLQWKTNWRQDRNMIKGMIAYSSSPFTIGVESFINNIRKDVIANKVSGGQPDTLDSKSIAISIFARGRIYKDLLGFFVRYDNYNPAINNDNKLYSAYLPFTKTYDPNTKEQFFTAGIDYSPINKIHIMPNIWYNLYNNASPREHYDAADIVLRLSIYYIYGK